MRYKTFISTITEGFAAKTGQRLNFTKSSFNPKKNILYRLVQESFTYFAQKPQFSRHNYV